jgi:hypothetical protein
MAVQLDVLCAPFAGVFCGEAALWPILFVARETDLLAGTTYLENIATRLFHPGHVPPSPVNSLLITRPGVNRASQLE